MKSSLPFYLCFLTLAIASANLNAQCSSSGAISSSSYLGVNHSLPAMRYNAPSVSYASPLRSAVGVAPAPRISPIVSQPYSRPYTRSIAPIQSYYPAQNYSPVQNYVPRTPVYTNSVRSSAPYLRPQAYRSSPIPTASFRPQPNAKPSCANGTCQLN